MSFTAATAKFSMKIRNSDNQEWKSDNENNETGNIIKIKSEELDPTAITFTGTINLKVKPQSKVIFKKLLKLKHNQSHEGKS
jgi:hypothetical protein